LTSSEDAFVQARFADGETRLVGRYQFAPSALGRPHGEFRHVRSWYRNDHGRAFALDPVNLPLSDELFVTTKRTGLFGPLADTTPDAWGRRLVNLGSPTAILSPVERSRRDHGGDPKARDRGRPARRFPEGGKRLGEGKRGRSGCAFGFVLPARLVAGARASRPLGGRKGRAGRPRSRRADGFVLPKRRTRRRGFVLAGCRGAFRLANRGLLGRDAGNGRAARFSLAGGGTGTRAPFGRNSRLATTCGGGAPSRAPCARAA
jgi:hypothetical protein